MAAALALAGAKAARTSGGPARARTAAAKAAASRPTSTRRRRRAPRTARKAAQELRQPVERQVVSGFRLLGIALAVIALYHLLSFAESDPGRFGKFLSGPAAALAWLGDPHRSIPYGTTS